MALCRTFKERILGSPGEEKTLIAPLKDDMGLRKTQLSANNGPAQRPPKVSLGCAGSSKTTHQSGTHCERCRKADRADRCAYATAIAVPSSPVAARFISVPRGGSVPTVHDAKQRSRRNGNPGFTNQGEGGGGRQNNTAGVCRQATTWGAETGVRLLRRPVWPAGVVGCTTTSRCCSE